MPIPSIIPRPSDFVGFGFHTKTSVKYYKHKEILDDEMTALRINMFLLSSYIPIIGTVVCGISIIAIIAHICSKKPVSKTMVFTTLPRYFVGLFSIGIVFAPLDGVIFLIRLCYFNGYLARKDA